LRPDGSVAFSTNGPYDTDWTTQNVAGEFAAHVDPSLYDKLAAALERALPNGPRRKVFVHDAGIEAIAFDSTDRYLQRQMGDSSVVFDSFARIMDSLATLAVRHPVSVLQMSCKNGLGAVACRIESVGPSPALGPDLSDATFFCFDPERHMNFMGGIAAQHGRQTLAPGKSVEFRLEGRTCAHHLVMDRAGAILVSNPLTP
jgi:hypothetical protein